MIRFVPLLMGMQMRIPTFNLSDLDGTNGFQINGIDANDNSGSVSSAGDVNGDGIDDIIIGASGAEPDRYSAEAGESYVVFGSTSWSLAELDLSTLNGTNGFQCSNDFAVEIYLENGYDPCIPTHRKAIRTRG